MVEIIQNSKGLEPRQVRGNIMTETNKSQWFCPKCGGDVEMLAKTSDTQWISCECYKTTIDQRILLNNDIKALTHLREASGWKVKE